MSSGTTIVPRMVQAFALAVAAVLMAAGLSMLADASTIRRELEKDRVIAARGLSGDTPHLDKAVQELAASRRALEAAKSREPESALERLALKYGELSDAQAAVDMAEFRVERERYLLSKLRQWRLKLVSGRALAAAAAAIAVFVAALHLPPPRVLWFSRKNPPSGN